MVLKAIFNGMIGRKASNDSAKAAAEANRIALEYRKAGYKHYRDEYIQGLTDMEEGGLVPQREWMKKAYGQNQQDWEKSYLDALYPWENTMDEATGRYADSLMPISDEYGNAIRGSAADYDTGMREDAGAYGNTVRGGAANYGRTVRGGAGRYSGAITGAASVYGEGVTDSADIFSGDIESAAGDYSNEIGDSADSYIGDLQNVSGKVNEQFDTILNGEGPLAELKAIGARDAANLTPAQVRALDKLRRASAARVAAGGLRGAGRAGVAVANDADAAFLARTTEGNQDRIDSANFKLADYGVGATRAKAQNIAQFGQDAARAGLSARDRGASAVADARGAGARAGLSARDRAQAMLLDAAGTGAKAIYGAETDAARTELTANEGAASALLRAGQQGRARVNLASDTAAKARADARLGGTRAIFDNDRTVAGTRLNNMQTVSNRRFQTNQQIAGFDDRYFDRHTELLGKRGQARADYEWGVNDASAEASLAAGRISAEQALRNGAISQTMFNDAWGSIEKAFTAGMGGGGSPFGSFQSMQTSAVADKMGREAITDFGSNWRAQPLDIPYPNFGGR